jgi:hypothetical protein
MRTELSEVRAQHAAGESEIAQLKIGIADSTVQNVQLNSELAQAREVCIFNSFEFSIYISLFILLLFYQCLGAVYCVGAASRDECRGGRDSTQGSTEVPIHSISLSLFVCC